MKAPEAKLSAWAKRARTEAEARAKKKPTALLEGLAKAGPKPPPLERALRARTPSLVAELRRKDLSGDWLDRDLDVTDAASAASRGNAAALFLAIDPHAHAAVDGDIARARKPGLPVVLHDAVTIRHQVVEARLAGAAALTLHAALHDTKGLAALLKAAAELGMQGIPLVSDVDEANRALDAGAAFACVDLCDDDGGTLHPDRADTLVPMLVKAGTLVLVRGPVDATAEVSRLAALGAQAVVVTAPFVRAGDRAAFLSGLAG